MKDNVVIKEAPPVTDTSFTTTDIPHRPIRLLIVDDHQVVREGLRRIIEMENRIQVVGEATNGEEAIAKALALSPDIVVMDLKMPRMDGIAATYEIKQKIPEIRVLMLTLYAEDFVKQAIEAGASGYLLKDSDTEQIIKAIHQVYEGYYPIAPSLTRDIVIEFAKISRSGRTSLLSRRQLEVLKLIADGYSSKEISAKLYISTSTVKREIRQILNRLEVSDRAQAVSEAMKRNLI
ncbi:MAG: response regulator transcription factor [Dehalococcoidales bacterium]|nr:MAG: response regulator transcription factor [Dehalococcoidales bacterium]